MLYTTEKWPSHPENQFVITGIFLLMYFLMSFISANSLINPLKPNSLPTLTMFSPFVPYFLVVCANLAISFSLFLMP